MALPEPSAEVVARVQSLAAASQRPTLTADEVTAAIKAHPMMDRDGYTADEGVWTQTWDLNAILSELWGVKAGKVAGDFNFSADDARYDKGEVLKNCLEMEALYASRRIGAASTLLTSNDVLKGVVING
jgi:hypothetical protein